MLENFKKWEKKNQESVEYFLCNSFEEIRCSKFGKVLEFWINSWDTFYETSDEIWSTWRSLQKILKSMSKNVKKILDKY